jgi:hypothetical protein
MCDAGLDEARIREIIREEIQMAGLADAEHDHPELANEQHEHYDWQISATP